MKNITISQNFDVASKEKLKLYSDVFGYAPRNEGFICGKCNTILAKDFYGACNCGEKDAFKPFYNYKELKDQCKKLAENPGYCELIAKTLEENVGFILGRNTNLDDLNRNKLGLDTSDLYLLQTNITTLYPDFDLDNFFYCADMGVKSGYRGQGVASLLYQERLKRLQQNNQKYLLVRTTKKTDKPYEWYRKLGFQEVYDYNDQQSRVILSLII